MECRFGRSTPVIHSLMLALIAWDCDRNVQYGSPLLNYFENMFYRLLTKVFARFANSLQNSQRSVSICLDKRFHKVSSEDEGTKCYSQPNLWHFICCIIHDASKDAEESSLEVGW
jgi:hypothetical protein